MSISGAGLDRIADAEDDRSSWGGSGICLPPSENAEDDWRGVGHLPASNGKRENAEHAENAETAALWSY